MQVLEQLYSHFEKTHSISTDSRRISEGCIFFALHGDNFDGNQFVIEALNQGAAISVSDNRAIVEQKAAECGIDINTLISESRIIFTEDTLSTLQGLARFHRRKLAIPILAITGSCGKTTTKELIARVLSCKFRLQATEGNLNNHIGVPLTLLKMDSSLDFAIVEMGASHRHEIELLTSIAEPDYGIITNIGKAHLEGFGGEEGVRLGKGELVDFLDSRAGTFFYLCDEPKLRKTAEEHSQIVPIPYSLEAWDIIDGPLAAAQNEGVLFRSQLTGAYNIYNIVAAVTIGRHFGISDNQIAEAIASYEPTNNRSQRSEGKNGNIIIKDAYNANPLSMAAAIDSTTSATPPSNGRMLILGEMRELGEYSDKEHKAIFSKVERLILDGAVARVIFVGDCWRGCQPTKATDDVISFVGDKHQAAALIAQTPISQMLILVKGSRGVGLELLFDIL